MQLLHLDSSVLGAASVSRQLSAQIVGRQQALHPGVRVVVRDLAADPALHLSGAHMAAFQGATTDDATITADLLKGNAYMDELFASDIIVIGAPMYNLSIPTPAEGVDRPHRGGRKDVSLHSYRTGRPAEEQEGLHSLCAGRGVLRRKPGSCTRAPGELPPRPAGLHWRGRRDGRSRGRSRHGPAGQGNGDCAGTR